MSILRLAALCAIGLLPLSSGSGDERKETNIPYVQGGDAGQQLDLYLPKGKGFATVLFVHGGGLTQEDRKDAPYPAIAEAFQSSGVACALMNYRLLPGSPWPSQPQDVAAAAAWLKKNISSRGGDPGKVILVGHSSGGMLVALVACNEKYLKEVGLSAKDIAGCVPMGTLLRPQFTEDQVRERFAKTSYFKQFGSPEAFLDSHPSRHIGDHLPSMLILIAEAERYQPPILADSEAFISEAKQKGAKVSFEILKDRTHRTTIANMTKTDDPTLKRIVQFVEKEVRK